MTVTIKAPSRMPILWIALGRQRVGKTAVLNSAVQYFREAGSQLRIWNADQQNRSHSLSQFFPEAETVPPGGIEDTKAWIERRLEDLIEHRYDAVLDVGGGATGFSELVKEVPLLEGADQCGVRVVGVFCTGPERADLDYLEQFAGAGGFLPPASVIVTNAGLVLTGRSADGAFAPIITHPAVRFARGRGAKVAMFPNLPCMAQVTDRGVTFRGAMDGETGKGEQPALGMFDRMRVNKFWTMDIPAFFAKLPPEWLPLPAQVVQTAAE
jgi:hypothetical protein